MKIQRYPQQIVVIRHGLSVLNKFLSDIEQDKQYQRFLKKFRKNPHSASTQRLANRLNRKFVGKLPPDAAIPLSPEGRAQAITTGMELEKLMEAPDVIICSSYKRARHTLEYLKCGWFDLNTAEVIYDDAFREAETNISNIYMTYEVFLALNPQDKELWDASRYFYRFPRGENFPDLIQRVESAMGVYLERYAGKKVLIVGHHGTNVAIRSVLEEWNDTNAIFMQEYEKESPNCGVLAYTHLPWAGKLRVDFLNKQLW